MKTLTRTLPALFVSALLSLLPVTAAGADGVPCGSPSSQPCTTSGTYKIVIPACYCDRGNIIAPPVFTPIIRIP